MYYIYRITCQSLKYSMTYYICYMYIKWPPFSIGYTLRDPPIDEKYAPREMQLFLLHIYTCKKFLFIN